MRKIIVVVLAALPMHVFAQTCNVAMSVRQCLAELSPEAAAERMQGDMKRELATINTGGQPATASSTDDFNPKLQASVDAIGTGDEPGDGLTMSLADPFRDMLRKRFFGNDGVAQSVGQHHKLVVTLAEAKLFDQLDTLVTDPLVKDELERSLDDFSNVVVDFRLSPSSATRGRDLQQHIGLVSAIQTVVFEKLTENRRQLFDTLGVRNKIIQSFPMLNLDQPLNGQVSAAEAVAILQTITDAHTAQLEFMNTYDAAFRQNGLDALIKLVNNQPQLVFSVKGHIRDNAVGPDEYSAKFTYEFGGANVNRYGAYATENNCTEDVFLCLSRYLADAGDVVDDGVRFAASIEYSSHERYEFANSGFQLNLPSDHSLIAKLTYGRYVSFGARDAAATDL